MDCAGNVLHERRATGRPSDRSAQPSNDQADGRPIVFPYGPPSITRGIRSESSFFNENYTFVDFLIDL